MVRGLPADRLHIDLESALLVSAEGYWASHYDFGLPVKPVFAGLSSAGSGPPW